MDELNFLSKEETSTKIDEIFSELSNKLTKKKILCLEFVEFWRILPLMKQILS